MNLIIGANLPLEGVQCRVLLTTPLEFLTAGNTIILSKGLIDTLPNEEALAMVISFQLAHISLGHQIESRFGFSDAMFFNDNEAYTHVPMAHSAVDNAAAAQKALNSWDDTVQQLAVRPVVVRSAADKLPFELTPVRINSGDDRTASVCDGAQEFYSTDGLSYSLNKASMRQHNGWTDSDQQHGADSVGYDVCSEP